MVESVREFGTQKKEKKSRDRDWTNKKTSECALVRSKSQKLALGPLVGGGGEQEGERGGRDW